MRCRICGAELRDGDDRCPDCGQRAAGPIRPAFESRERADDASSAGGRRGKSEAPNATVGIAPGEVLAGRYEVVDEIGTSLLARLYRARDLGTGAKVVLRVIHAGLLVSRDERESTQRALRAAVGIEGRHLCAMIDVGEHGERLFAVEPAVDAVPLGRVLRHRRARGETFAPREVLPVVAQSAAALASLPAGRAHGNLDPSLVLVHADGLRLVGAQIALSLPVEALARATRNANVSALAYLAPEVRAGARPTPASDRYAIAAIACECLTGKPSLAQPDDDEDDDSDTPSRDASGARLPQALERALARCLDPVPEERAPTLAELVSELASTAGLGVPSLGESARERPRSDPPLVRDERRSNLVPTVQGAVGADPSGAGRRSQHEGASPGAGRRDQSEPTRRVPMDLHHVGAADVSHDRAAPSPARSQNVSARVSPSDSAPTARHSAMPIDPTAPTREEELPPDVVAGGAADRAAPRVSSTNEDRDDALARKAAARRPVDGAADGTAEIELDQLIEESSPGDHRAARAASASRPARERRDSAGSIPSLGAARKSPSLPSLSVPVPSKAAAAAPAGATALSASASRSIPMTHSGSIPIELMELDGPSGPSVIDDGSSEPEAAVPSLLSAARRHASRPHIRAVPSEPPRAVAAPVAQSGPDPIVVPEGVTGIPRVRPPSGEQAFSDSSEVLFDDSHRPRARTRAGDPTRTEVYDRSLHDLGASAEDSPRRRSRWFVWASVLLALVILAVGLVIYLQRRDYAERRREIEQQMQGGRNGERD